MTFAAPLKVTLRLIVFEVDEDTGAKSVKDIKEQDVYMGDMPFMTDERHFHRQRHRARHRLADAPLARRVLRSRQGQDALLRQAAVRRAASSRIAAPGLDIEFDAKDIVHARIDRRRKIPVTSLMKALGLDGEEILDTYLQEDSSSSGTAKAGSKPFDVEKIACAA
jgi:DNA-directed RNA polymerase subunit beta